MDASIILALAQDNKFSAQDRVDYWGDRKRRRARQEKPSKEEPLFGEPLLLPDGRTAYRLPPRTVREFLSNPTRENAERYLAWQKTRMTRLKKAMSILSDLRPGSPAPNRLQDDIPKTGPATTEILYFKKQACPWCRRQDQELSTLLGARRDIRVRTLYAGQNEKLWRSFRVKVVPTMVILRKGEDPVTIEGYISGTRLQKLLVGESHATK